VKAGHRTTRRRYLVAYDIRDPTRLRTVHRIVKDHGTPLQYSVFLCDLAPAELTGLRWKLGDVIAHAQDSVLFLDLGDPGDMSAFTFLGERADLPTGGPTIL
jgi:CRISPR-associated protein Cas2